MENNPGLGMNLSKVSSREFGGLREMKEIVVASEIGRNEGSPATAVAAPPQALVERLKDYGQEDAFAFWDELSSEERDVLVKDIQVISHTLVSSLSHRSRSMQPYLLAFSSIKMEFTAICTDCRVS